MTLRDTGTEEDRAGASSTIVAPIDAVPVVLRTGAALGWWRVLLGLGAAGFGVRYVLWQASLSPETLVGRTFIACEGLALSIFLMTLTTLLGRGTRAAPGVATGTLDVFVTVCGEPPDVVEAAVRTALAIDYPHRTLVLNDGRVAGGADWEAIDRLGKRLGVEVLTRVTGRRGKAGNLNHALAHSSADFVATIDGDHRADPDFAVRLLRWFNDSKVAFVAAGQRFDVGLDILNHRQPFFFDWLQPAKDASGCAISCGSGVIYRRAALDDVGGFSEWNIVEDLHTSYRLHAAGWTSVYERQPVTTGLAPQTSAEYAHQRARWALDTMRILFFDNPALRSGMRARVRLNYLHTTTAYLLAIPMSLFLIGAPLYVLLRVHVSGGADAGIYASHAIPYLGALVIFFASMVGFRGAVATFRSSVFDSWITVVAIGRALFGARQTGVTKKSHQRRASWLLAPQIIATCGLVASLVVALIDDRPGSSVIAVTWAAINALALAGPLAAVSERQRTLRRTTFVSQAAVGALGIAAVTGTLAFGSMAAGNAPSADPAANSPAQFVVRAETTITAAPPDPPVASADVPRAAPLPPEPVRLSSTLGTPAVGAYTGVSAEGIQSSVDGFDSWSAAHGGARPAIVSWFQHWGSGENRFRADWVQAVADQGAVPMITWEPWARPDGEYADPLQPEYRLELIVAGEYDTYARSWAQAAAQHGGPILLRFMHEFNGEWYPWSVGQQGQTPELYVAAWRHVHDIFVQEGATNVSWVWSVIGGYQDPAPGYPGDDVVDWVAATVLNTAWPEYGGWFEYSLLGADVYDVLAAYDKPIMLSEVATHGSGGDSAAWLADLFATVEVDQPLVRAVVIFDMPYDDRTDFRLTSEAAEVLATATAGGWFAPPIEVRPT